jgi:uncharacterized protein (TIGR02001 family)
MNRAMNSGLTGLGVVALALASGAAHAEVTSTVTATTDYDFRGITQTALDPAFQASLDWSSESGLYAGLWGSNVDFGDGAEGASGPNVEVDLILGYSGSFTENFGYDVGGTYYKYLGESTDYDSVDYYEFKAGFNYTEHYSTTFWYSPDYGNSDKSAWYLEANADYPLPWWELGTTYHVGYSTGDYWSSSDDEYYDWAVGLTRSFGHFDFALKYVDGSDLDSADCSRSSVSCGSDPVFSSQSKVVFSIATTFPWGKEE